MLATSRTVRSWVPSPPWSRVVARHAARFQSRSLETHSQLAKFASLGLFVPCQSSLNGHLLQGASHAVVGTLYSRAHRIGLDGSSCLLCGLCKQTSFVLLMVVTARTLIEPVFELLIFLE
jgi:hypothetical protein